VPQQLHPDAGDIAELHGIRWRELDSICTRLGRMSRRGWDKLFRGLFVLLIGGAGGAAFGLIPFLSTTPPPSTEDKRLYVAALGITLFVGLAMGAASLAIKSERDDSVEGIREDLNMLLAPYREQLAKQHLAQERDARRRAREGEAG
jgi:hypothetical protein